MIPQIFEYSAPETLAEALSLLKDGEAKVLAGGQSLIPMMKLRLATPGHVVDLSHVPGLSGIREDGGSLRIGALTTHFDVESSAVVRARCPLLAETAAAIGDVQVRNMGTIGGSVAHADPSADYPAALIALEAKVKLSSASGTRTLAIGDFLVDTLTTALDPGEIVEEIIVPVETKGVGVSYQKMVQPASGFAVVGIAARVSKAKFIRIGVTGVSGKAYRAMDAEVAYTATGDIDKAAARVADGVDANSDIHASADFRKHLAGVYCARAIRAALARV